jgi:hypothetical protein
VLPVKTVGAFLLCNIWLNCRRHVQRHPISLPAENNIFASSADNNNDEATATVERTPARDINVPASSFPSTVADTRRGPRRYVVVISNPS